MEKVGKLEGSFPGNVGITREIVEMGGKFAFLYMKIQKELWKTLLPSWEINFLPALAVEKGGLRKARLVTLYSSHLEC